MNPLEKLFSELEQKTVTTSADDGFPSAEFRRMVLNELKKIKLGRAPRGNYWNPNYNTVEKFKIDYFTDAGNIGENLAQKYLAAKILLPSEHFLRPIINTGLKFIGSEIARVYALEIYPELQKVQFHYARYQRQKRTNHMFPAVCYPAVIVPLDQDSYDFSCEVINRIGNEQCQCGGNYCLPTLAWRFSPDDGKRMRKVFQEIRIVLEYFSACLEFLLNHEKEYPHA